MDIHIKHQAYSRRLSKVTRHTLTDGIGIVIGMYWDVLGRLSGIV